VTASYCRVCGENNRLRERQLERIVQKYEWVKISRLGMDVCSVRGHTFQSGSQLDQSHGWEPARGDVALLCSEPILKVSVVCVCLVECFVPRFVASVRVSAKQSLVFWFHSATITWEMKTHRKNIFILISLSRSCVFFFHPSLNLAAYSPILRRCISCRGQVVLKKMVCAGCG